jgi:hypothetical protein
MALHRIARWALSASLVLVACSDTATSATDLHPEGPPMIEQVRLKEVFTANNIPGLQRVVFGFGTHSDATASDEHPVMTAAASGNRLRIIMDELLRGNFLEEIQCRATIRTSSDADGAFGKVPVGDTPDDIARCAAAQDVLPVRCPGSDSRSVCICELDGGCLVGTSVTVPKGQSVGVNDVDHDGAADATQLIPGAVGIKCGTIDVPADPSMSYWNPSGDQQVPAQGGFDALGPAVVLVPKPQLPTSQDCTVVFGPSVVDKDGNQVCAPPNGDITAGCTPGDTSAVHFQVEPMGFLPQGISDPGQSRTSPITLRAPASIDPASITGITVTEGTSTPFTNFTPSVGTMSSTNLLTITWGAGGLAAATRYTITIPTTVTDSYHFGPPQPIQISFTTSAN